MPSQTLSLSQQQQLQMVLAPQLRQSLEMLQLPILELRAMIQQEIEQNPTIEEVPTEVASVEIESGEAGTEDTKELDLDKEFEMLSRLDEEWRDYFFQNYQGPSHSGEDAERRQFLLDSLPQTESLQEHLLEQLTFTGLSDTDRQIGELIIGSIDDGGYLTASLEELSESAGTEMAHLQDVLLVIQEFHPTGVGARDLRECLLLQLERAGAVDTLAWQIVSDHLDKLGGRKLQDIARALKRPVEEIQEATGVIARLDPRPGRIYSAEVANYILPEIVVQRVEGQYVIILNDDQLPHVRISNYYRSLLNDPSTKSEVKTYVQDRIRSGAFLIKSIHQRQKTIHRIASEIVEAQEDFLEYGVSRLRPLTMAEVAEKVGVHETTVSRAVSGKYMKTPSGIFELKYFFTPGIKTQGGGEISNKTVKDIIGKMVAEEDPQKPLSDQEIVEKLQADGIQIARRTVAKYRLVLRIPPSHMRRSY
jgi:RNA polymerase sigma-54 factor